MTNKQHLIMDSTGTFFGANDLEVLDPNIPEREFKHIMVLEGNEGIRALFDEVEGTIQ